MILDNFGEKCMKLPRFFCIKIAKIAKMTKSAKIAKMAEMAENAKVAKITRRSLRQGWNMEIG